MALVAQMESLSVDDLPEDCQAILEEVSIRDGITHDEVIERAIQKLWNDRQSRLDS